MAKKKTTTKGRSGNPAKRAALAAVTVGPPCIHCGKNERNRGGLWCNPCVKTHRSRGRNNRPSAEMVRACIAGLAVDLGVADADGNLLAEA